METLKLEFTQLPCGCWDFRAYLDELHDVPPDVIRAALREESETWEEVHREEEERMRRKHELYARRN